GFTLPNGGQLSGTSASGGLKTFDVTVTDAAGATASGTFNVTIRDTLLVSTATLPSVAVSTSYVGTPALAATGGRSPYTFTLQSGTLPGSITFNTGGVWSGSSSASGGVNNFAVRVTDA